MEEYTQITLDQWVQWKEGIRKKLQETAGNFVYIGYCLRKLRDSGDLYEQEECEDIFEFAKKEYGLDKSTVSRFIAINEKYSEGGYSMELQEKYRGFGQSKLVEMLSLPDAECELITEQTTVKEIRELKAFVKEEKELAMNPPEEEQKEAERCQEAGEEAGEDNQKAAKADNMPEWTPLQKCIIDFFKDKKDLLKEADNAGTIKEASELIAPSGNRTHRKGSIFLLMYDYDKGVAYRKMGFPEAVTISWDDFYCQIDDIYWLSGNMMEKRWSEIYEDQQTKTATTTCQPAKPVDVWEEKQAIESVRNEPENDLIEDESDKKTEESVQNEPENVSEKPESAENEPETVPEPVATSQQRQISGEYEEIIQRYDMMLRNLQEIKERMENMLWDDAYNILLRLKVRMEEMVDEDPKLIKAALESTWDDE